MSLHDLLEEAAAAPAARIDVDELWRRGRRRRVRARVGVVGVVAVVGLLGLTAVVPDLLPPRQAVGFAPPDPGPPLASPPSAATPGPEPSWEQLTLDEAVAALVAVNQTAPTPSPSHDRVVHTVGAYLDTTIDSGGTSSELRVELRELRVAPDGSGSIGSAAIAPPLPPGTSADELRALVEQADLDRLPLQTQTTAPGELDVVEATDLLAEAEREAADPTLPTEGESERPPRAHAFTTVADALRETAPGPDLRVRALTVLGRLEPYVEYRGPVRDLLGREGVGIAGLDPANGTRHTLIFSPETGEVLGEEQVLLTSADPALPAPALLSLTAVLPT